MQRLLITGGAGYIGSHAVKHFLKRNLQVVVIDTFENGNARLEGAEYLQVNTGDSEAVRRVCREHRFDAAMHFAAYASVEESMQNPLLYFRNNTIGTMQLVSTLIEEGVRKFVLSSTCAVYGEVNEPIGEEHAIAPCNPYGASKALAEEYLRQCSVAGLLDYVSLRYFNAAGDDPEGEIGECHEPERHLIPNLLRSALDRKPVRIFGDDYPTPDGTCVRDYVHVEDLVGAHALSLDWLHENRASATYNVGTEKGYSIREVLREASRVCGNEIPHEVVERRSGDPPFLVASARKIKQQLGWKPAYGLTEILSTALQWEKRRKS
jgi:UDP-glucose 4-epimerase